ncbi:MAG TPA: YciI family protein [Streptosporangiaceae bacterium]|nr:YciI family protein [Streptosporangiaceae bacterium]
MRYLLLIRGDESAAAHADDGCDGWSERMLSRGVLRGAGGLRPPAEGKAVRVRRRQLLLSDGPFAETKEQIAGLCILECADLDEAVEAASRHPAASYGTIEVRPMRP